MVRAHIHFSGTVQGVGFRYTTLSLAKLLLLTGWVKNLSDGRVEAIVEGPVETIEDLRSKLKVHFGSFLHDQQIEWLDFKNEFNDFLIR